MTRYLDFRRFPVTCPYGDPRPTGPHTGQDHACSQTPLIACETGLLQYAVIRQRGDDYYPNITWPDGSWWPYFRYYEWWAGGLAILYGEQYTHVWCHIDPRWIYSRCDKAMVQLHHEKKRKPGDFRSYVIAEVTWQPLTVAEGDIVAVSGVSGYDDGPHVHYQLMAPGKNVHTVLDPRSLWG